MKISLLQFPTDERGERGGAAGGGARARRIRRGAKYLRFSAVALRQGSNLVAQAGALGLGDEVDLTLAVAEGRIGLPSNIRIRRIFTSRERD